MPDSRPPDVTKLLRQWREGRSDALEQLFAIVYGELRALARRHLGREGRQHTLQPTELVHEAYARLANQRLAWQSRAQFYFVAATCMRRILVDHARRKRAAKRPPPAAVMPLDDDVASTPSTIDRLLLIDEALTRLSAVERRQAQVAELKIFGGLEIEEIAHVAGVSPATVKRDWAAAKETLATFLRA